MSSIRSDIDDCDVQYMYEVEGMSQRAIADYYDVSKTTIYYRLHPEKMKEHNEHWREERPEYKKQWLQTVNGKEWMIRANANRRNLGSIELNIPFPNSEGHHIDDTYIIHIPKELHRSIKHNIRTDEGMEDINTIAFGYISEETFDKLIAGEI